MGRVSTTDRARSIALEVASYRPDYGAQRQSIVENVDFRLRRASGRGRVVEQRRIIGSLASSALDQSHAVIRQAEQHIRPRGRTAVLTRRTLAITALAGTPHQPMLDTVMDDCCLGAELKFVHGLEHHRLDKHRRSGHAAALILHDAVGEPLAYQKAIGHPYAYVWRDGLLRTRAGLKRLFAGSIVRPVYGSDGQLPPHQKYAGFGLVGVAGCVADDVESKRLSVEVLPEGVRTAALLDASAPDAYTEYRCHVAEASAMTPDIFAAQVTELAKATKTYTAA